MKIWINRFISFSDRLSKWFFIGFFVVAVFVVLRHYIKPLDVIYAEEDLRLIDIYIDYFPDFTSSALSDTLDDNQLRQINEGVDDLNEFLPRPILHYTSGDSYADFHADSMSEIQNQIAWLQSYMEEYDWLIRIQKNTAKILEVICYIVLAGFLFSRGVKFFRVYKRAYYEGYYTKDKSDT